MIPAVALMFSLVSAAVSGAERDADGVFLRHLQKRDSVLVGDRVRYGVKLEKVEDGTTFLMPDISAASMAGDSIAVSGGWHSDTLRTIKGKKGAGTVRDIEISMDLVPFEEGSYRIQGISLLRVRPSGEKDTLRFDPQLLEVKTMQVDTTTYVPHDIRPQARYPLTISEVLPYVAAVWLAAVLAILAVALYKAYAPGKKGETRRPDDPPHIVALRRLDTLRGDKLWALEKQKVFYSGVTDALREYISSRYGFGAKEMTTAEIFNELKKTELPGDLYDEMKTLFESSDLVKFAKTVMPDEYNSKVIPRSVRFVTETYREAVDEEAEKAAGASVDSQKESNG